MKSTIPRSDCPLSYSLDILGDKWTLLILRDMMLSGKSSFSEFMGSTEKIASNILIDRLNMLQSEGFVTRTVSPLNKSKFLYTLSEKSIELVPVVIDLIEWGAKYHPTGEPKSILPQVLRNKSRTIKELQERLREGNE